MRTRPLNLPASVARPLSGALLLMAMQGLAAPATAGPDLAGTGGGGSGTWGIGFRQPFGGDDGWAKGGFVLAQNDAAGASQRAGAVAVAACSPRAARSCWSRSSNTPTTPPTGSSSTASRSSMRC